MKSGSRKNQRATWEKENQLILLLKIIHFERKNIHDISKIVPFQVLGEGKGKDGNSRIKISHSIFRLNISKYVAQQNITKHVPHQNGEGHRHNGLMPGQVTQLKNFFPDGENLETLHFFSGQHCISPSLTGYIHPGWLK